MRAMSPELVLVDEALRPAALAALPECPDVFTALKQRRSGDPIRQLRAGLTISEPIPSSATDGRASWLSRGLVVAAVCASPVTSIGLAFTTGASARRSARLSRIEAARHRASRAKRALGAGAAVAFAAAAGLAWSSHSGNTASTYVARSGGMVAFGLLTASVLLGILLAGRKTLPRWPRFAVEDVHRFAGTLTWTFIGVHVAGLLVDTYIGFSLQVLIPFTSSYRPAATAAGIVGAELLAAIAITNQLKDRLPHSLWRRTHYLNFAVWALSLVHGVTAGTDTHAGWAQLLYLASATSVVAAIAWRGASRRAAGPWTVRLAPVIGGLVAAEFTVALILM